MVAPATITVYDFIYDSAGSPLANATIYCVLNYNQATTSGGLNIPLSQNTDTDSVGRFAFTVVCNDLISPANTTYTIKTPLRSYDIAPQSANGSSQQSTAANVIVNTPFALAPWSLVTGPLTINGELVLGADLVRSHQSIAYAATITPSATAGEQITVGTLTGNIAINRPTGLLAGQYIAYKFTQDGTGGRTVTFDANHNVGLWAVNLAPNAVSTITFKTDDGTSLQALTSLQGLLTMYNGTNYYTIDGATDGTTGLNQLLSDASGLGGRARGIAYLPPGTVISSGVVVPNIKCTILGGGWGQCIIKAKAGTTKLFDINADNCHIYGGLTLDGNGIATYGMFLEDNAIYGHFEDIEVKNVTAAPGMGVANTDRCYSSVFERCHFHDNTIGGSMIKRSQANIWDKCGFYNNVGGQFQLGDDSVRILGQTFRDSFFEYSGPGSDILALQIKWVVGVICDGVTFAGPSANSIEIQVDGTATHMTSIRIVSCNQDGGSLATTFMKLNAKTEYIIEQLFLNGAGVTPINDATTTSYGRVSMIDGASVAATWASSLRLQTGTATNLGRLDVAQAGIRANQGAAPTAAAGAGAGTGPPAPIVSAGSTNTRGDLTCGTGTATALGAIAVVTFAEGQFLAAPKAIHISPMTAGTALLGAPYATTVSATGFSIAVPTAPAINQANTVYGFRWIVVE